MRTLADTLRLEIPGLEEDENIQSKNKTKTDENGESLKNLRVSQALQSVSKGLKSDSSGGEGVQMQEDSMERRQQQNVIGSSVKEWWKDQEQLQKNATSWSLEQIPQKYLKQDSTAPTPSPSTLLYQSAPVADS